jgi:putative transcriptional regulator
MDDEGLRNTLKVQRAMRDLTQADLADHAGVTRKSVNAIETGRMVPSVVLALKLARALSVAVETIFALDGRSETARSEPFPEPSHEKVTR